MNRFFQNTGFVHSKQLSEEELSRQLYHFPIVKDFACYCVFNVIKKALNFGIADNVLIKNMEMKVSVEETGGLKYTKKPGFSSAHARIVLDIV